MAKIDQQVEIIFNRLRKIELLLAFVAGTMIVGGGSVAAKVFGFLK